MAAVDITPSNEGRQKKFRGFGTHRTAKHCAWMNLGRLSGWEAFVSGGVRYGRGSKIWGPVMWAVDSTGDALNERAKATAARG